MCAVLGCAIFYENPPCSAVFYLCSARLRLGCKLAAALVQRKCKTNAAEMSNSVARVTQL